MLHCDGCDVGCEVKRDIGWDTTTPPATSTTTGEILMICCERIKSKIC